MRSRAETIAEALRKAERPLVISGTALGDEAVIQAAANVARPFAIQGKRRTCYFVTPECNSLGLGLLEGMPPEEAMRVAGKETARQSSSWKTIFTAARTRPLVDRLLDCGAERHLSSITSEQRDHSEGGRGPSGGDLRRAERHPREPEGRAQRFFRSSLPPGTSRKAGAGSWTSCAAAGTPGGPAWQNLDDVTAAMVEAIPALKTPGIRCAPVRISA